MGEQKTATELLHDVVAETLGRRIEALHEIVRNGHHNDPMIISCENALVRHIEQANLLINDDVAKLKVQMKSICELAEQGIYPAGRIDLPNKEIYPNDAIGFEGDTEAVEQEPAVEQVAETAESGADKDEKAA